MARNRKDKKDSIPQASAIKNLTTENDEFATYISESYQQDASDKEMEKGAIHALGIQKDKTDFRRV